MRRFARERLKRDTALRLFPPPARRFAVRLSGGACEEDLLAVYLSNLHGFGEAPYAQLAVTEGSWTGLVMNPRYLAKKQADEPNYVWDAIIEEFTKHTLGGTLVSGSHTSLTDNERVYRVLAAESRLSRRVLSNALGEKVRSTPKGKIAIRTVVSEEQQETIYVFVCMANPGDDEHRYRSYRRNYLSDYCHVVSWKFRYFSVLSGSPPKPASTVVAHTMWCILSRGSGRQRWKLLLAKFRKKGDFTRGRCISMSMMRSIQTQGEFLCPLILSHCGTSGGMRLVPAEVGGSSKDAVCID